MKNIVAQKTENATEHGEALFRRGQHVSVRDWAGNRLRRRVWQDGGKVVYVCTDRLYSQLRKGIVKGWPIGFPKADVSLADVPADQSTDL